MPIFTVCVVMVTGHYVTIYSEDLLLRLLSVLIQGTTETIAMPLDPV